MPPPLSEQSGHSRTWQSQPRTQLLAAVAGVLPLYTGLMVYQLRKGQPIPLQGFVIYLAVISPLAIAVALLLLRFLCGESPRALNLKPGKLSSDLIAALVLFPVIIAANVISNYALFVLLPNPAPDTSVRDLFVRVANSPGLLVLFLTLLIPLGAASEEVIRVFFLSRLWKVWPNVSWKLLATLMSACLFGLIHVYRGPAMVVWTAGFGLIAGLYYLRYGRVVPLILAHYLTNALQVVVMAMRTR